MAKNRKVLKPEDLPFANSQSANGSPPVEHTRMLDYMQVGRSEARGCVSSGFSSALDAALKRPESEHRDQKIC
jgi:hypothetical protein